MRLRAVFVPMELHDRPGEGEMIEDASRRVVSRAGGRPAGPWLLGGCGAAVHGVVGGCVCPILGPKGAGVACFGRGADSW